MDETTTPPSPSPLSIEVYPGKSLSELFRETINDVNRAQQETILLIEQLKEKLNLKQDDSLTDYTVTMMLAPILKDFITEFGKQSESKVKIATAVANIVKAQQTAIVGNQMLFQSEGSILGRLGDVDPLAKSFSQALTTSDSKKDTVITERNVKEEELRVIHSPDFLASKSKAS